MDTSRDDYGVQHEEIDDGCHDEDDRCLMILLLYRCIVVISFHFDILYFSFSIGSCGATCCI
jgi:hypothetical protein